MSMSTGLATPGRARAGLLGLGASVALTTLLIAGCGEGGSGTAPAVSSGDSAPSPTVATASPAPSGDKVTDAAQNPFSTRAPKTDAGNAVKGSTPNATATDPRGAPVASLDSPLEFTPPILDLGDMQANVAKTGTIKITNTSSEPVTITRAVPGCGCTTLGWPRDPIAPGESADVEITMKPGPKQGIRMSKRVTFQIKDHAPQVIKVEGDVIAYVLVTPDIVPSWDGEAPTSGDIVIESADETPFRITGIYPPVVANATTDAALRHVVNIDWGLYDEENRPVKVRFDLDHPSSNEVTILVKRSRATRDGTPTAPEPARARPTSSPFIVAAQTGDATRIRLELADGAEVNLVDPKTRRTALHWAAVGDHVEVLSALIEAGADLDTGDRAGKPALALAAEKGNIAAVRVLVEGGAGVNVRDQIRGNPLLWAAALGTPEVVGYLLEHGADASIADVNGFTPLLWAAATDKPKSVELLIAAGADVNARDQIQGESVLMRAARNGSVETIDMLLEASADINATTRQGANALHVAAEYGTVEKLKRFIEAGLDPKSTDARGWNALDYAKNRVDSGRESVQTYLEELLGD